MARRAAPKRSRHKKFDETTRGKKKVFLAAEWWDFLPFVMGILKIGCFFQGEFKRKVSANSGSCDFQGGTRTHQEGYNSRMNS